MTENKTVNQQVNAALRRVAFGPGVKTLRVASRKELAQGMDVVPALDATVERKIEEMNKGDDPLAKNEAVDLGSVQSHAGSGVGNFRPVKKLDMNALIRRAAGR